MKLAADRPAATENGSFRLTLPSNPPSAGPQMKPRPKAAPILPKLLARFSGVDTSDAYADATDMLAEDMPPMTRPMNRQARLGAHAVVKKFRHMPAIEYSSTGRRPTRSLTMPSIGMKMNCIRPKVTLI